MYGLYDKEGVLRFVDSDKDACIAYAELFELGSKNRVALLNWAMDNGKICRDGFNCCTLPDSDQD